MRLRWQGFAVPKRGNSAEEYEDAFAANPKAGRFAIADGASESSFASLWAKLLVEGFTHPARKPVAKKDWLAPLCERWSSAVDSLELPWYAEAKRALGASATFLGLRLKRSAKTKGGIWLASAVGDSCIFQIHKEKLVAAIPLSRSQDFGNQPKLLNSLPGGNSRHQDHKPDRGKWRPGDRFLLMTDALAQWFLHSSEAGQQPWQSIDRLLAHRAMDTGFVSWIETLRDQDLLRNDDVTLVVIDL